MKEETPVRVSRVAGRMFASVDAARLNAARQGAGAVDWIEFALELLGEFVLEAAIKAWRWVKNCAKRRTPDPVSGDRADD